MNKIAFSGTLDPITNGHMWVIQEARSIADEVVIFISENPFKKPQFSAEKRKTIVEHSVAAAGWSNVTVTIVKGDYTARAAKRHGIDYLIRGIRNTADFDYENLIQQANVDILQGAKTIYVMPPRDLGSVSSSFVRALQGPVGWHWSVKNFLPGPAYSAWILDWLHKEWDTLWQCQKMGANEHTKSLHWFNRLVGETAYGSVLRPYHNLDHLVHGLSEINVWAANTNTNASENDVATLKKAFWFHDAAYDVPHKLISNEEASARLWIEAELATDDVEGPASLIRATDHLQSNTITHPLKDVMLSIDLAILGQRDSIYDAYSHAVRIEYAIVEENIFRENRKRVLTYFQQMAASDRLFPDRYFADLYGQNALENLSREIANLA